MLGIDTSGYANAVGVTDGEKVLADLTFPAKTDSLEQIVANIDDALKCAGLTLEDIGGIGVGLGPGSWTGIRVGVTVGKVLAFSTGKPLAGIPTLEVLAYQAIVEASLVCAVIPTGAGDAVYAACYQLQAGVVGRVGDYFIGSVKDLTGMIKEPVVLAGDTGASYMQTLRDGIIKAGIAVTNITAVPGGAAVARLASERLERGERADVLGLEPLYLKESTARAFVNRYAAKTKGWGGS
ncbi:MAG: tRNA (adenosine(37)-N6)-threonylcarbamoyltransferase complex dimerization subunit type 1 TsaB [Chloroflexi bacterium RBG_16_60_22]|nr:MAG: tRNA (adenosine(37)-N6)-threonylcarbamoyltransferase complex dimerization subunit type 1 TsaB [Chloroflexi bacterium RBG_16_60_22]